MRDKGNNPRKFLKLNHPDKKRRTNKEISARRDSRLKILSIYSNTGCLYLCPPSEQPTEEADSERAPMLWLLTEYIL
jgi:hypothetical protein